MRWFKSNLKGSFQAIFSSSFPALAPTTTTMQYGIEDIRQAMLALAAGLHDEHFLPVLRRIRYTADVQGLWFMRGDLMRALATSVGEAAAREMIEPVSDMFADLLPDGLRSRPSPLSAMRHPDDPLLDSNARESGFRPS